MPPVKVKICGITNPADAVKALELGADAIGFIFYDKSPRFVEFESAMDIMGNLRSRKWGAGKKKFLSAEGNMITVGVFANEDPERVRKAVDYLGIDIVQLSGGESIGYINALGLNKKMVLKSVRVGSLKDLELIDEYKASGIDVLLDAPTVPDSLIYGGTGRTIDLSLLKNVDAGNLVLAGGIGPDNVTGILNSIAPYALDLSSKIEESPGIKDHVKMSMFFENFRRFNNE